MARNTLTLFLGLLLIVAAVPVLGAPNADGNLSAMETLGQKIYFDKLLSSPPGVACADCHAPLSGWTGPVPGINKAGAVYPGAVHQRAGNRKPPSAAYATPSPLFDFDGELFFGGNFWDGRATGWVLGNPAADQAMGPFLNPVEQNNADSWAVVGQICRSTYADLFVTEFQNSFPGVDPCDPANVDTAYGFVATAIATFENSAQVNPFSSKYDAYLAGDVDLSDQEQLGLDLFEGKAKCSGCHLSQPDPNGGPPLFTDFTFDNLGVPINPDNPFYRMDQVFLPDGSAINPLGSAWVDLGLGNFLRNLAAGDAWRSDPFVTQALLDMTSEELSALAPLNDGKQKVPTLRNVDLRPGRGFAKAYMHNGVFKSLKEVVHFYNARDAMIAAGTVVPEVSANMNTSELGNLGLTPEEEDAIVVFMKTLSDGYRVIGRK